MRSLYIQYECCQNVILGADDIQCFVWLYAITPNLVLSESLKITRLHGCFNSSLSFSTDVTAQQTPRSVLSRSYSAYKRSQVVDRDEEMLYFMGPPKAFIYCYVFLPEIPPIHGNADSSAVLDLAPVILTSTRHQPNTSSAIYQDSHLEALKLYFFFFFFPFLRQLTANSRQSACFQACLPFLIF